MRFDILAQVKSCLQASGFPAVALTAVTIVGWILYHKGILRRDLSTRGHSRPRPLLASRTRHMHLLLVCPEE